MGKITVLEKQVADLIAAGEVVERPASAIKEMIENAIDAGATLITVEIKNGGVTYLRVSDNGSGIAPEDVPLVFLRHATSKIHSQEDLGNIGTLGFRGEAMASIAAVGKVELLTKPHGALEGTQYAIYGGEEVAHGPAGCPQGTTIIVRDLFYNTPARMKFLKKDSSEANTVASVVEKAALSHPEISFKLIRDGQIKLHTPGDGKLLSTIHAVYGKEFAAGMIPVEYTSGGVSARGYVCKPANARGNRTMQTFFINGRFVKSKTMMAALEEAYKHSIMVGKFPACVLNIALAVTETDVNVHPAKIEVRFSNEKAVFDAVYYGVKSALQQYDYSLNLNAAPKQQREVPFLWSRQEQVEQTRMTAGEFRRQFADEAEKAAPKSLAKNKTENTAGSWSSPKKSEYSPQAAAAPGAKAGQLYTMEPPKAKTLSGNMLCDSPEGYYTVGEGRAEEQKQMPQKVAVPTNIVSEEALEKVTAAVKSKPQTNELLVEAGSLDRGNPKQEEQWQGARMIGELFGTYILLENGPQFLMVDKHAAHERLLFQQLKQLDLTSDRQFLLAPVIVTLSKEDYAGAVQNLNQFEKIGFLAEDFGNGDIIVREVPVALPECDIRAVVEEAAHNMALHKNDLTPEVVDDLLHNIACRSAVKAHDKNTTMELEQIIRLLRENEEVKYCPHGRPIARIFTKREIEKMFGRVN